MGTLRSILALTLALAATAAAVAGPPDATAPAPAETPAAPSTAPADDAATLPPSGPARETLDRLLKSRSWARRAIAAVRLERYEDDVSRELLLGLLADETWQVRAFAVRSLGRRRVPIDEGWLEKETDPRVVRALLRHRYPLDVARLERGVNYLVRRQRLDEKLLGVELAAASGDAAMHELADETMRTIMLRMSQRESGALSPRLAALTGQGHLRRRSSWQRWLRKAGRPMPLGGAWAVPEDPDARPAASLIARLDEDRFFSLEDYIAKLAERRVDLAICLDTTGSMWGELAEAQSELDDMMIFASDVVRELRVGLVAYRDKRSGRTSYETTGWDLTADVASARAWLWQLDAGGGGDTPEAVFPALRRAYGQMSWAPEHTHVTVLIGDAPPHPGFGSKSVEVARMAADWLDMTTHAVQAAGKDVKHFAAIAEAGGGRCVNLEDGDSLVVEITGLTLGDRFDEEFREFFAIYLALCR
ncbi:MAG: hypothetical protein ACYTJ0_13570 [Planctomycetota bacterium]|jgi:Mg-chelatase subunit ChlD